MAFKTTKRRRRRNCLGRYNGATVVGKSNKDIKKKVTFLCFVVIEQIGLLLFGVHACDERRILKIQTDMDMTLAS